MIIISEIKTEPVRAEKEVVDRFRVLVKKKYGKLKCVMGEEMTDALEAHCKKLEKELQG